MKSSASEPGLTVKKDRGLSGDEIATILPRILCGSSFSDWATRFVSNSDNDCFEHGSCATSW